MNFGVFRRAVLSRFVRFLIIVFLFGSPNTFGSAAAGDHREQVGSEQRSGGQTGMVVHLSLPAGPAGQTEHGDWN